MPIYEYICGKCEHAFEHLLRSSDEKPKCPQCGSTRLDRQFSTFAAQSKSASAPCGSSSPCAAAGGCPSGRSCPMG